MPDTEYQRALAGDGGGRVRVIAGSDTLIYVRLFGADGPLQIAHNLAAIGRTADEALVVAPTRPAGELTGWRVVGRPAGCPIYTWVYHIAGAFPSDSSGVVNPDPLLVHLATQFTWAAPHPTTPDLYSICDVNNDRIWRVESGVLSHYAGNGTEGDGVSGLGGAATSASLGTAYGMAMAPDGTLLIGVLNDASWTGGLILAIDPDDGIIRRIAGTATSGLSGDGGASASAQINFPRGMVMHGDTLYFVDSLNSAVRTISPPFDGTGTIDMVVTDAALFFARSVALDSAGTVYITCNDPRIRTWDGATLTVFGGSASTGRTGNGGPVGSATMNPLGLAIDSCDRLYVSEGGVSGHAGDVIRRVDLATGIIDAFAGNDTATGAPDPSPQALAGATFNFVEGNLAMDGQGLLYVADDNSGVVRRIGP